MRPTTYTMFYATAACSGEKCKASKPGRWPTPAGPTHPNATHPPLLRRPIVILCCFVFPSSEAHTTTATARLVAETPCATHPRPQLSRLASRTSFVVLSPRALREAALWFVVFRCCPLSSPKKRQSRPTGEPTERPHRCSASDRQCGRVCCSAEGAHACRAPAETHRTEQRAERTHRAKPWCTLPDTSGAVLRNS